MRIYNEDRFNYPVLKNEVEDYKTTFEVEIKAENKKTQVELKYNVKTDSEVLKKLISEGKANVYIHCYAPKYFFRRIEKLEEEGKIVFSRDEVFGDLDVTPVIMAETDFKLDMSSEAVEDEDVFQVKKNTIIGFNETSYLQLDFEMSKLEDIVVVERTRIEDTQNRINIQDDRITYYMSYDEYSSFDTLYNSSGKNAELFSRNIHLAIYTKLLTVIYLDQQGYDEIDDIETTAWYQMIESKMDKKHYNIHDFGIDDISKIAYELAEISYVKLMENDEGE